MYCLELAGEDDAFATREAATATSDVTPLASGLAVARGLDRERVRGLAYTRRASELVGYTDAAVESARRLLRAASIDRQGTVAVRARDVRGKTGIDTQRAERELGTCLVERGFAVDLDAPDHELRAVFAARAEGSGNEEVIGTESIDDGLDAGPKASSGADGAETDGDEAEICALGWLAAESVRGFGERAPTRKPFFQPGSMDPLLARAVCNIAGAGPGTTIVDPMCGTGGVLVEAGLVGSSVVGADAQAKMVWGARTNLERYLGGDERDGDGSESDSGTQESEFAVLRGDATRIPLRDGVADGVCFDVPYGRQSKITGDLASLVSGALAEARRLASRTVIVGDRPWTDAAREAGWTVESVFERRVHRSLTRHVMVLEPA